VAVLEITSLCIQNFFVRSSNIKRVKEGVKMNLIHRAVLAIVGVWLAWSQLGQLTIMINTRSINVLGLVLLAVGILLLLFAIKPNFLRTKRWGRSGNDEIARRTEIVSSYLTRGHPEMTSHSQSMRDHINGGSL
jgi:hypothetical protein